MSIFNLAADQLNQEYRRACYYALATHGYPHPDLYFERKDSNCYMSYWGSGNRRAEVLYNTDTGDIFVYGLKFAS